MFVVNNSDKKGYICIMPFDDHSRKQKRWLKQELCRTAKYIASS